MTLAHWLMKLTLVAAPRDRTEWAHAMAAEFAALDRNANHISWVAGCLGAVFMWRLQASALYLVALAALPVLWNSVISSLIFDWSTDYAFAQSISQEEMGHLWMALDGAGVQVTLLLIAAALSVYRPQYALITALGLWLATTGAGFISTFWPGFETALLTAPFSSENNNPALPNIIMALFFFGADLWPVVLGSFLGWAFARGKRGLALPGSSIALALVIAEYAINPGESPPALTAFTMISEITASAALIIAAPIAAFMAARNFRNAWRAAHWSAT